MQKPHQAPRSWICSFVLLAFGWLRAQDACAADRHTLAIYFIDVEGGQSTLLVTPEHQSLLIDTGWAGQGVKFAPGDPHTARDANRILAAAHDAGVSRIDYLLVTHFHDDHDGGVSELAKLIPIGTFIDHGAPNPEAAANDAATAEAFKTYQLVRAGKPHIEPKPGDRLPLQGVTAVVVSSAGTVMPAGTGHLNARCSTQAIPPGDPYENPRSTGILLTYGRFRFLDVGDLTGQPLFELACPRSLVESIDIYLVAHHGGADAADPATFAAFAPRVAVMNNGMAKGGARSTYELLHQLSGTDVWQLHASNDAGPENFPERRIANLDESTAYWLRVEARADGSFTVFNPRTGQPTEYARRPGR
jgi:competence protein ComEC